MDHPIILAALCRERITTMWRVEARTSAGDYLETTEHWATPTGAEREAKRLRDHYRAKGIEAVTTITGN
jgi:hypothetical protein